MVLVVRRSASSRDSEVHSPAHYRPYETTHSPTEKYPNKTSRGVTSAKDVPLERGVFLLEVISVVLVVVCAGFLGFGMGMLYTENRLLKQQLQPKDQSSEPNKMYSTKPDQKILPKHIPQSAVMKYHTPDVQRKERSEAAAAELLAEFTQQKSGRIL